MPLNRSSIFLEVIENLSKSIHISEGNDIEMAKEILYSASHFLKIPRANAWIMSEDEKELSCLIAYDKNKDDFYSEGILNASDLPVYFKHIRKNDIIISFEAREESFNSELLDNYLIPNNIYSMMEVPILLSGEIKGILCFENTNEIRNWNNDEQHFALALTQLLSLTLETKQKNIYRDELEKLVKEKSVLIAEINHRVKNNLAVITALIRAESNRVKDEYHRELFKNILSKSFSLSTLQSAMYQSKDYNQANFSEFIRLLLGNINDTYGYRKNVQITLDLEEVNINISKAIPCSLIINEILTNCYKYAFTEGRENKLLLQLKELQDNTYFICISDNGAGLPKNYASRGTGFDLMDGLIEQIDANINIETSTTGTTFTITFK
jgi:two-component sensor histidine kinase